MENGERIKDLRQKIDRVDEQILRLLNERAEIVLEVGKMKSEARSNFYDPKRESEVLHRLMSRNAGPFPGHAISPVFHEIISACRSLEVKLDVVYLGPEATNTHMACLDRFGSSIRAMPKDNIPDVFEAVERGEASYGVVPYREYNGRIGQPDIRHADRIGGEDFRRNRDADLSRSSFSQTENRKDILKIYSHPQALGQCRKWLRKNYPSDSPH